MPTLIASVNGALLAQVLTDGFDVMSIAVQGTCIEENIAELLMTGSKYPKDGESVYLTWINSLPLRPDDLVEVTIQDGGETLHRGKTFAELFPDEGEPNEESDFTLTSEIFADLRSKERLREGFRFELETSHGTKYVGKTEENNHGFGLSVLWNAHRPARASLSLHSYTIDDLEHKTPMRDHVREYIEPLTVVRFSVNA